MIIFSVSTSQWSPQEDKVLLQWHCVVCSVSFSPAFQAPGRYFTALHGSRPSGAEQQFGRSPNWFEAKSGSC